MTPKIMTSPKAAARELIQETGKDVFKPPLVELRRAYNFTMDAVNHICFMNATLTQPTLAAALGVSEKTVERNRGRGMPCHWKTNPERDRLQWMFCGMDVFFWCIRAGLDGKIEMPPAVGEALDVWKDWYSEMKTMGAVEGKANPATYEESLTHWDFMLFYWHTYRKETEPCPWLIDIDNLLTREEFQDRARKIDESLALMREEDT